MARDIAREEINSVVMDAMEADKREGQRLAVKARWIALAVIAVFLVYLNPTWAVLYYEVLLPGFAAIAWVQLKLGRVGFSRPELFLMACDLALMTFTLVVPNPFYDPWPLAMQFRFENFIYFFVLLAGGALAYSWRTIIAMGVWTTGLWTAALIWVFFQPIARPELSVAMQEALAGDARLVEFLDPNMVPIHSQVQNILVFLIVAATLALGGWRAQRLLVGQAEAERERANLARYFPPNIIDQLADRDQPLGAVRTQSVAVMFVDIVGFTLIAERQSPEEVVATLRDFHGRMETAVFDNSGTLDKFLGDGLMATFGTPDPGPHDASNAVQCARAMVAAMTDMNRERAAAGSEPMPVSIGIHYGEVVLGDVGSERRLEFAVLGDVVNVASRLEALTRQIGASVVISDGLVNSLRDGAGAGADDLLDGFHQGEQQTLRGRDEPIGVWMYA